MQKIDISSQSNIIDKKILYYVKIFLLCLITFFFSKLLLFYQTGGDQIGYRALYDELASSDINEIIALAYIHIGGAEPVSVFFLWLGAVIGINKDIYISLLNVLLVCLLYLTALRNKVSPLMTVLLLLNFYIIVLMVSAERLKISYIFLLFAANTKGNAKKLFLLISVFAHFQTLILMLSLILDKLFKIKLNKISPIKIIFGILFLLPIFLYLFNSFFQDMFYKFSAYKSSFPISEFLNIFLLIASSILVIKEKFKFIIVLSPILLSIYFLGGTRVNMIAVTFVLYHLIEEKKISNILIYPLMMYLVIKSFWYINLIVKYGDGFI